MDYTGSIYRLIDRAEDEMKEYHIYLLKRFAIYHLTLHAKVHFHFEVDSIS